MMPAVRLYVGFDASSLQGRRFNLLGPRMFNGQYGPFSKFTSEEIPQIDGWCDSGAFNDKPEDRLTPDLALDRQLAWEMRASEKWNASYRHNAVVSYDLLIDEKWVGGRKKKERWSVSDATAAVRTTVAAAAYLSSQRQRLAPRRLILACQGVDAIQYEECAVGVLAHCRPGDVFGLGGWCILGRERRWLPTFWASMRRVIPLVAARGLDRVHIFGVTWVLPLGGLVHICDQYGISVSTDGKKPAADMTWRSAENAKRAGRKCDTWEENCQWWIDRLANLRSSIYYRPPPVVSDWRQGVLF